MSPLCFFSPTCPSSFSAITDFDGAFQNTQIVKSCKKVNISLGARKSWSSNSLRKKKLKKRRKSKRLVFHFKQSFHSHHTYKKFSNFYVGKNHVKKALKKKPGENITMYMINREFLQIKMQKTVFHKKLSNNINNQSRGKNTNFH